MWLYILIQLGEFSVPYRQFSLLTTSAQLDYSAGVLPITHVDGTLDKLENLRSRNRNAIERGAYADYDSIAMDGLPVGVQVVGQRLEEEKVIEGMKVIEGLLRKEELQYQLLNAD